MAPVVIASSIAAMFASNRAICFAGLRSVPRLKMISDGVDSCVSARSAPKSVSAHGHVHEPRRDRCCAAPPPPTARGHCPPEISRIRKRQRPLANSLGGKPQRFMNVVGGEVRIRLEYFGL